MVIRPKPGILFLLLILCAAALFAQTEALRLGGSAFLLPEDWPHRYEPPEVLFRVKVNPDSTLGLVRVLDGKTELEPLLSKYLLAIEYVPSGDSLSMAEFDAILDILQTPESSSIQSKQAQQQLLGEIEDWIVQERQNLNFYSPARNPAEFGGLNSVSEPYRSGFYFYGPPENSVRRTQNRFEQRTSLFAEAYADFLTLGFLSGREKDLELAYGTETYPYQVTLSAIEVGIGGYEQLFARGLLKKNRLFGVERLYLGFAFLIQDGTWLERDSGREALLLDLSVPLGKTTLDLAFADHRTKLSQRYLRPEYWRDQDFSVERHYRSIYAAWRSPWLNLALLNENDSSEADVFTVPLQNDALRLRAWETLSIKALNVTALYERMFTQRDLVLGSADHTDLVGLELSLDNSKIKAAAQAELSDFESLRASAQLGYSLRKLDFGVLGAFRYNDPEPLLWVPSPYIATDSLSRVEIRDDAHFGLYLNWQLGRNSRLNLSGGRRYVSNQYYGSHLDSNNDVVPKEQNVNYLRLTARLDETWSNWNLNWQPGLVWQGGYTELFAEPQWRWQSHLNLSRLLGHDNALFAGFSLLGHSFYLNPDSVASSVDASLIMDTWIGVQISKRFEFQISYKNLFDSGIYGANPLPGSLQASLRWFFLN